jgi:hypothetical protein
MLEYGRVWIGLILVRIGPSVGLLWKRQWTFGFHKMWGISRVGELLLPYQEGLSYMECVGSMASN